MFCSTIIPTIGRKSLDRSVLSVLGQDFSEAKYEIIVVNDSGRPLEPASWQHSDIVQILNTNRHDKSVARNVGAAIARGEYLHFLDDDDWMLPGAFSNFWKVANENQDAVLLYGSSQLMDRKGYSLYQLHHTWIGNRNWVIPLLTGEWMPLGAYMIKTKTFFEVGGVNPLMPTFEERDVCRRVSLRGEFAGTSDLVSCQYIGEENSTTDFSRGNLDNYISREIVLDTPGVLGKMVLSVQKGSWYGRILRIYAASAIWNIRNKSLLKAASRAVHGFISPFYARKNVITKAYWRAFSSPYNANSFIYPGNSRYIPLDQILEQNKRFSLFVGLDNHKR